MTNLAARNKQMKGAALRSILEFFPHLISISIPEDVNEITMGLPETVSREEVLSSSVPESEEDAELGCHVTVGGHVTECVLQRLSLLTQWVRACSGGEVDADKLHSKLLGYLSLLTVIDK